MVNSNLEDYFLDLTSEGNQDMMEMMDQVKAWKKKIPDLDNDLYQQNIPVLRAFKQAWKSRTELLDRYYKEFANEKDKLKASLVLLGDLPTISSQVVNTRKAHQISSAHSRLVKTLIGVAMSPPPQTEEDWMAMFTTIDSSELRDDS